MTRRLAVLPTPALALVLLSAIAPPARAQIALELDPPKAVQTDPRTVWSGVHTEPRTVPPMDPLPFRSGAVPQQRARAVPPRQSRIGVRAYFLADSMLMTASESFEAVVGSSQFTALGGGGEALRLWRGLFARAAVSDTTREGDRVALFDDEAIPLGIPLEVRMTPVEIGGGWRSDVGASRSIGVYGGGGFLRVRYRETSQFAGPSENIDESYNGYVVFGGADVTIARWLMLGAEVQYRTVPDAIGSGGVSAAFDETDLGGIALRVMVGIRR
jgi:hypothetical protein